MIAAPLAMFVVVRPLLAEFGPAGVRPFVGLSTTKDERAGHRASPGARWRCVFIGGAIYSSFLALRNAPVAPAGHGGELRAFLPIVHGEPVLYAGQDRYAAYELLGADTHVPLVEFPDPDVDENPEKPFDTGDAYSPIDFDSFSRGTLDRFPYVITGRAAWNSQAPRAASSGSPQPPPTCSGSAPAKCPKTATCCSRARTPAPVRAAPRPRSASCSPTTAAPRSSPTWRSRRRGAGTTAARCRLGERTAQTIALPRGRWRLSLQYFSPFGLTLSAPGFRHKLKAALDGQRPNTISLANDGQFWPAGSYRSRGGRVRFTVAAAEPSFLQRLSGYDDIAYVGNLVAVRAGKRRAVPLSAACNRWIDSYESLPAIRSSDQADQGLALRARTPPSQGAWRALHASDRGRRYAPVRRPWRRGDRKDAHNVPGPAGLLEQVDDDGREVDLPAAEAVHSGGREGVVVVVPGLAEGRDRDQRQVARLVGRLEVALAEDVAERVDAVGEVVQDEDADEAAPEQAGDRGEEGAADHPAEREGEEEAEDRPVDERAVDPVDRSGPRAGRARSVPCCRAGCG